MVSYNVTDTPNLDCLLHTWANTKNNPVLSPEPFKELQALKDRVKELEAKHEAPRSL